MNWVHLCIINVYPEIKVQAIFKYLESTAETVLDNSIRHISQNS